MVDIRKCHSENTLRCDSWVPNSIKMNFISNLSQNIKKRCSNDDFLQNAKLKIATRLEKNGYKKHIVDRHMKTRRRENSEIGNHGQTCLNLDFISDRHTRYVHKILNKYDFSIRLFNKPGQMTKVALKDRCKSSHKHQDCEVCDHLPKNFVCNDRFIVYKFTCQICNQFYIGETCRPFYARYLEHKRSLNKRDDKSALSCHINSVHNGVCTDISKFHLQIINKCDTPVSTRLAEARAISIQRPALNRKHEIAAL